MELYHYVGYEHDSRQYMDHHQALTKGLSVMTKTGRYTNGGRLFPEITEKFRPKGAETWIVFDEAVGAEFTQPSTPHFKFPVFTHQIYIFNKEISSDLFAYIEDEYMKGETGGGYFTKGLPSKEDLVKQYWDSMISLEDYCATKPYKEAEILLFDTVPPELLEFVGEKGSLSIE